MAKIHTITITNEYTRNDCIKGIDWLINDIISDINTDLKPKIKKPVKATVVITYSAIDNGIKGKPYDNDRGRGQRKKQNKDRG